MDQPPARLAIQSVLRPAFVEDSSVLNKYMDSQSRDCKNPFDIIISAHGNKTLVEVEDYRRAQPDAIAHSASKNLCSIKSDFDCFFILLLLHGEIKNIICE